MSLVRSIWRRLIVLCLVCGLNIAVFGVESGLQIVVVVLTFWFGVYLPGALVWEYYRADDEERAEWRSFYRNLLQK